MGTRWYVAQTHPSAEVAAVRRLARQEFEAYSPTLTLRRPVRRGHKLVTMRPLFPGYILVKLDIHDDPTERWKKINSTRAIVSLLPRSDRPLPVPVGEIESIQQHELAGNFIWPRSEVITPRTKLVIDRGTFSGQIIECLACDDIKGTVRALLDCLGAKRVVTVPLDDVAIVSPD